MDDAVKYNKHSLNRFQGTFPCQYKGIFSPSKDPVGYISKKDPDAASHFRKVHHIGFPVGNQRMTMVYQIPKTCMCSTENQYLSQSAYISIPRFSYNYSVSNVLQKDPIPVIYL
jgi:hypothetical protein